MVIGKSSASNFNSDGAYPCPVCRHGQLFNITLMEALACNFCRHIFIPDEQHQQLTMADSSSPMTWRWNGRAWRDSRRHSTEIGWFLTLAAVGIVLVPTALVVLASYIFPPIPNSRLAWVPLLWIGLTFIAHLAFVISLALEYYQFPVFTYLQAAQRYLWRFFQR